MFYKLAMIYLIVILFAFAGGCIGFVLDSADQEKTAFMPFCVMFGTYAAIAGITILRISRT